MNLKRIKSFPALKTEILLVHLQNSEIDEKHQEKYSWYYQQIMEVCLTNIKQIIEVGRSLRMEIISTIIERLTSDDQDTNLDQKLSNIFITKNSY